MSGFGHDTPQGMVHHIGAASATDSYAANTPSADYTYTLVDAKFNQGAAIAACEGGYFVVTLHRSDSSGTHTDVMDDGTGADFSDSGVSHVSLVPTDIGLSSVAANLVVDAGEAVEIVVTKTGSPSALDTTASVTLSWLKGTGAGQ